MKKRKGDKKKMAERFVTHIGVNVDQTWVCGLSDEELAEEIRKVPEWDADLLRDLCYRANMLDEWEAAEDNFESIAFAAAEKLGVEIL